MTTLVRAAAALLLIGLAAWAYVSGELQFAVAGVAVAVLTEIGLALRARREQSKVLPSRPLLGAPGAELRDERPCLELGEPKWSVHGGIREACLTPRQLRLVLRAAAAEALGAQEVCVTLPAGLEQRPLERALRRVLLGVAFTSERSLPEEEAREATAGAA